MEIKEALELMNKALSVLCIYECGEVEDNCRHLEAAGAIARGLK